MSKTVDYPVAPRPAWRTEDGQLVDGDEIGSDDFEIDLTGDRAELVRKQWPRTHPWADQWPTWVAL